MTKEVSLVTRIAYCLVVLGAVVPIGLAKSGWVALALGVGFAHPVPFIGPILFLVGGLYRIFVVIRFPDILNSPSSSRLVALLRSVSILLLYVGAICTILNWIAGPLIHNFLRYRSESGAEFVAIGIYLAIFGRFGLFGLFLFEFSRLRSFEQEAAGEI